MTIPDAFFAEVDRIYADLQTVPAVRARDDGRAAGADGAATFTLPDTRVPLVFPPDGPFPGSPPSSPPDPGPPPPSWLPRGSRSAWRMAHRPLWWLDDEPPVAGDGPNKPNPMPPGTPPPGGPPGPPPPLRGDAGQLEPPVPQAGEGSVVAPASAPDSEGRAGADVASGPGAVPSLTPPSFEDELAAEVCGMPAAELLPMVAAVLRAQSGRSQ